MKNIYIFRIILWTSLIAVVMILLFFAIVPGGKITYVQDFSGDNFFINKLTPAERVEPVKGGSQKIIGDPVYFTLRTPRRFERARLEMKFKNKSTRPIIQAGVLADKTIWRYDTKPLANKMIDQAAIAWDNIRNGDVLLLQKEKKFDSIAAFLKNLPPRGEIAVYDYDIKNEFYLPGYKPSDKLRTLDLSLRGSYQFYTYIKDEDLDFAFKISDLNLNSDTDPIDIILYYDNRVIYSQYINDDGITPDSGAKSDVRNVEFKQTGLQEGVYKVEMHCNDDIVTDAIGTRQSKLAFINKIWLYGSADNEPVDFYTDSRMIGFMTTSPNSLQNIKAGNDEIRLDGTYKQISARLANSMSRVILEKGDITVSGNKLFAFEENALFNPEFNKADENLDIKAKNIKYIITRYAPPANIDGWQVASVDIDISNAYRENQGIFKSGPSQYSFMISVPGLVVQNAAIENVEIGEIRVELEGASLWEKLKNVKTAFNNQ